MTKCKQHRPEFKAQVACAPRQERKAMIRPDHPARSIVQRSRLSAYGPGLHPELYPTAPGDVKPSRQARL